VPEAFPRIDAAVHYLRQRGISNLVLLAHSCSVHMSIAWLEKNLDKKIMAYIGVGMGSTDKGQPMLSPFPLEKLPLPILDIRGEFDYPAVIAKAPDRWQRIKQAGNAKSEQRVVKKADHYFTDMGAPLLKEIASWLDSL
ncbi:MAG: alpha/beta hydrolase family protein, partial [Gammaproteobacteria bacterium]|nr:alpha/beta hydrolase family protein [Gammaproteobacteria bacterium]